MNIQTPFGKPEKVLEYLSGYIFRIAISDKRILDVSNEKVLFTWKDYRTGLFRKMTLKGAEFLRRFCQHILPRGFVRIRHYGLLSTARRPLLRELQLAFGIVVPLIKEKKGWKEICREHLNYNPDLCPCCGNGTMVSIEKLLPARSPPLLSLVPPGTGTLNASLL